MPKKQKGGGKKQSTPRNRKSLNASFTPSGSASNTPRNGHSTTGNSPARPFSLRDEVMNTERHHEQWNPAKRLRDQRITFVSAGTIGPLDEPDEPDDQDPLVGQDDDDDSEEEDEAEVEGTFDGLDDLDASDGAMASMSIHVDTTPADVDMDIVDNVQEQEDTYVEAQDETVVVEETVTQESVHIEEPAHSAEEALDSIFFVDTQGDNSLAFKGPKMAAPPRPSSPTPPVADSDSDSSEEVVFRGRRGVVVRDDPPKAEPAPAATPAFTKVPIRSTMPHASAPSSTTQQPLDALMRAIDDQDEQGVPSGHRNWGNTETRKEEPEQWSHADGSASNRQQAWPVVQPPQPRLDDHLSAVTSKPRSRRNKKQRQKQNKLLRKELDPEDNEDALLQDYINNMDPEDLAALGHGGADSDDESMDDLFNRLLDDDQVDKKLNPNEIVGVDTSSGSDSWGTDHGSDQDGEDSDEEEEGDDLDDLDSSDLESDLEYDEREQWEDEADLRQRQIDGMNDEEVARLLAKQEELGLGGDDLLLFDDSGFGDLNAARAGVQAFTTPRSRKKESARKSKRSAGKKPDFFPDATLMADVLDQDPYNGFDVMDFDRPSLRAKPKGRKSAGPLPEELGLSDEDLIADITNSWANDRSKKAARKAEREELRQLGLLGSAGKRKANKFKPDLSVRYEEGISMSQVRVELREFLDTEEWTTKPFPPMAKQDRKVLHEIAAKFNLKSKSVGSGKNRAPVLIKTRRTIEFSDEAFARAQNMVQRSFFRQPGHKGKTDKFAADKGKRRGGGGGGAGGAGSYTNGQVVGGSAPEIGATNFGRKLMEKMGWQAGMALGKEGNVGLLVPVEARIKSGKAGLG